MSDQKTSNNDAYYDLLKSYSASSAGSSSAKQTPSAPAAKKTSAPATGKKKTTGKTTSSKKKSAAKKKKRRIKALKRGLHSLLLVLVVLAFVFIAAVIIKIPIMGCVNDIIAIDRDDTEVRVVIEDGMNVDSVIDMLADKGLLYSRVFCKFAAEFLGYSKNDVYPAGTYDIKSNIGLEGMLNMMVKPGENYSTVKLTFPEGYTVDQIIAKLSENKVTTAQALYETLAKDELIEKYDFLTAIEDREDRYIAIEGYLYPDTYEFFIGEDPMSVLSKFLDNFAKRWTSAYDAAAAELGMSVDDVITLAAILEKEAYNAEQMPLIAGILYNRIRSTDFRTLDCDSTITYLDSIRPNVESDTEFDRLESLYNTYSKTGFPVGAICNPGADAIRAALYPEDTDNYFFLHDPDGNIYVARTLSEHNVNIANHLG